jgi:hypothetical protein
MRHAALTVVQEQLNKLAVEGSADAIALALEAQHVRALCGNANQCAIAVSMLGVLDKEFGSAHTLSVAVRVHGAVDVYEAGNGDLNLLGRVRVQDEGQEQQLAKFISRFDCEKYPMLIAPR